MMEGSGLGAVARRMGWGLLLLALGVERPGVHGCLVGVLGVWGWV